VDCDDCTFAQKLDAPYGSVLYTRCDNDPLSTAWRWWRTSRCLEAAEQRTGWHSGLVFFPYLDNFLRGLPSHTAPEVLLGRPWSGLYFRNQHLGWPPNGPVTALRRLAKGDHALRSRSALPSVGVLDERFDFPLEELTGRSSLHFPDITDETTPQRQIALAQHITRLAAGRPIVGLIGLEKRKGLITMLRAARKFAPEQAFFAAARPFHRETFTDDELEWIRAEARQLESSVFVDFRGDRLPDGEQFNSVFQTFDIAWAAYENFTGSSNTLTKAAVFEKPVLATAGECVGQRVLDFQLGLCIEQGSASMAATALSALLRRQDLEGRPLACRFADYRRAHSRARLDDCFRALLEQRLTCRAS
jgi:hypothetical protein